PDKALQDIVYKLVPGLFHSEMRRRQEFYVKHPERMHETTPEGRGVGVERLIYSPDDSISLSLEYLDGEEDAGCASNHSSESENEGGVSRRFLQCPALVTIGILKKFLRIKYELTSIYTVEIIHRRESLPDDYTLMDVAYIYTWKRNGPMKFFFRITHSLTGHTTHQEQQSSITGVTSAVKPELSLIVSHQSEQETIDNEDNSKKELQEEAQKSVVGLVTSNPEFPKDSQVEISTKSFKESTAMSMAQPSPVVVTKSMQSIPVSATVTSVSSALKNYTISSSQSLQTNSQVPSSRTVTKILSNSTSIALTKTTTVTKTTPSLNSNIASNTSALNPDSNIREVVGHSTDIITSIPAQEDSEINNGVPENKPVQLASGMPSIKLSFPNSEQSVSKSAIKELSQASSTTKQVSSEQKPKEIGQESKSQVSLQLSSSSNISQKTDHIMNGFTKTGDELSPLSSELNNCKAKAQDEKSIVVCKTETEETLISSDSRVIKEENKKISTPSVSSGSSITTKAALSKYVQQRLQTSAKKLSNPNKIASEASSTKGSPLVAKNQSQITKDANKIRTNIKITDKAATINDKVISKKDTPQIKSIKDVKIETSNKEAGNVSTSTQKDTPNSDNTPNATVNNVNTASSNKNINNNNINKVPQQNQQIIKNNQQILKKNDEIMRCVPVKRPIQPVPRKTQDVLKNALLNRDIDDKTNVKKRRVTITNPIKRPAFNQSDASKTEHLQQPLSKKPRLAVENNRKPVHSDQKTSQLKVKFPNPNTDQNLPSPVIKTETKTENTSNTLKNNVINNSNISMHVGTSELKSNEVKKQDNVKNNSINDRVHSINTVQKHPNINHNTTTSKMFIAKTSSSNIKTGSQAIKPNSVSTVVKGSPQNMTSPPTPVAAHANGNPRLCPTPLPPSFKSKTGVEPDGAGALDLSASPRRHPHQSILSIAQTLARRQQHQCPSPVPPLSPLSSLSPFPVMPGVPVRSPPPQIRIPIPHHRSSHSQQQRPSSLSSSSPSPPADTIPSSSRMGPPQQQQQPPPPPLTPDMYAPHLMSPATLMFRQQLELQRLLAAGKHSTPPGMEWYNDPNSIKRLMKNLQQQQSAGRNSPFYPFNNN
ncbi:hypothetical protein L9F63_017657, partial [Diploptera punctata]